jgi:dGTPase
MSDEISAAPWQAIEDSLLAPWALKTYQTLGRRHPEEPHPFRSPFQRDRERIVYSSAFRRMTGKTQVLVASVNDHHRTRLTHTLEVTQVARTVARRLRLNEDLTEAVALAHDIGHPPFGHAGEMALHECLHDHGGFNHNLYGLRRVDELEERYPDFPGLNLSYELREAFVRHSNRLDVPEAAEFRRYTSPPLEAQVVDAVDSIAYDTHDTEDALGLGLITLADLEHVEFWAHCATRIRQQYPALPAAAFRTAVVRELLAAQVNDLIEETAAAVARAGVQCVADVRKQPVLVGFSTHMRRFKEGLEAFLRQRVYRHHQVLQMTASGKRVLKALFREYVHSPELLPHRHLRRWARAEEYLGPNAEPPLPGRTPELHLERVVADYLAGMTDRFAQHEFRRLFHASPDL